MTVPLKMFLLLSTITSIMGSQTNILYTNMDYYKTMQYDDLLDLFKFCDTFYVGCKNIGLHSKTLPGKYYIHKNNGIHFSDIYVLLKKNAISNGLFHIKPDAIFFNDTPFKLILNRLKKYAEYCKWLAAKNEIDQEFHVCCNTLNSKILKLNVNNVLPSIKMLYEYIHNMINNNACRFFRHILNEKYKRPNSDTIIGHQRGKRIFSVLTRLRLFSSLSQGNDPYYSSNRKLIFRDDPAILAKDDNMITAKTRAYLRPIGLPLRWG